MRPPKFHPNRSIDRRVIAFPTFCNMAAVCHLEYDFCNSGPPTMSTMRFDYLSKLGIDPIFPAGDITIFISILTRDIDIANLSVCLSVCPSVRYVTVPYENGLTYRQIFFTIR